MTQTIVITGGAGFLGRAIMRRAERESWDARFIIYSRDEYKQDIARRRFPDARYVLGDVRDDDRLAAVFAGADLVIHAAALKYIPEAEYNVFECIDVNLIGSRCVAIAAARAGVETVVGLSTDKAAAPLNTYGMTKGLMERVFSEANMLSETRLNCVRYGNVISSTGSVVPVFKRQLAEHGCVRITDPRMTRFWLSVEDAIALIEAAAADAKYHPGAVLVPRCGAMRLLDLAEHIARDAPVEVMGLRPGEKLHETLVQEEELARTIDGTLETGGGRYLILPPISQAPEGSMLAQRPYRSDDPAFWLSPDDMERLIEDAETI